MKQLIQNYKTGKLTLKDTPRPLCGPGCVLVKNRSSLISTGTEKLILQVGRRNLIGKAMEKPEQFKRAIEKVRAEGFLKVWKESMQRLDEPKPLGYSSAGEIIEIGEAVNQFQKGDRVACIGAGFASHAEIISLPECLCAKIPTGLSFEEASFGMLGAIALQGVRCAEIKPGEKVAVLGLGLIGQITAQLLKAHGCSVIASDLEEHKLHLARTLGCDRAVFARDMERAATDFSSGEGVDKVIITAASKNSSLIMLAAQIAKFRAKIVLVGTADLRIPRQIFWEKELEFQVSKGAGYDPMSAEDYAYPESYKALSQDVNLREFLDLVKERKISLTPLVTHRFFIKNALKAYEMISNRRSREKHIGVLLKYDEKCANEEVVRVFSSGPAQLKSIGTGVIGAGIFARTTILPLLKKVSDFKLLGIATTTGNSCRHTAEKFNFKYCTTDYRKILNDNSVNNVFILTRHNLHAKIIKEAMELNKNIFVEKPFATTMEELKMLYCLTEKSSSQIMVGFNRRFSPLSAEVKKRILSKRSTPLVINIQVNAGNAPKKHWVFDEKGGRITGEACHFVDLAQFFTDARPVEVFTQGIKINNQAINFFDNTMSLIKFDDGSICNITYVSTGNRSYAREKITIFDNNAVYEIEDFRILKINSPGERKAIRFFGQRLGYKEEILYFLKNIKDHQTRLQELKPGYFLTTLTTLKMVESLEKGRTRDIRIEELGD